MYTTKYTKKAPKAGKKAKTQKFAEGGSVADVLNATPRPPAMQAPRPVGRELHPAIARMRNTRAEIANKPKAQKPAALGRPRMLQPGETADPETNLPILKDS